MRPSLMHDTVSSRVTNICPLGASRWRADGNLPQNGLIGHLIRRMYVLTHETINATRYFASLALSTARWPGMTARCFVCGDFLPEREYITFGSLLSQFRLSSVCLSVTLVHSTQGVETFGKISSPLCTVYAGHLLTS